MSRRILHVLVVVLAELYVAVLVVESLVLGQDHFLVVPFEAFAQFYVRHRISALGRAQLFKFLIERLRDENQITFSKKKCKQLN